MPTSADIQAVVAQIFADAAIFDNWLNADATTDVTFAHDTRASLAKIIAAFPAYTRANVRLATLSALPNSPSYANGTLGLGATLTATVNGGLSIDGVAANVGDRVLVGGEAAPATEGLYVVTSPGSVSSHYVLTRAADADTQADLVPGIFFGCAEGATYGGSFFVLAAPLTGAITVGTTGLTFRTQASLLTTGDLAGLDKNDVLSVTSAHLVVDADAGKRIECSGDTFFAVSFGAASGYANAKHANEVVNLNPNRRIDVSIAGYGVVSLFPGQNVRIKRSGTGWTPLDLPRHWRITADKVVFASDATGSTANDGLHSGSPLPLQFAISYVQRNFDCSFGHVTIQILDGAINDSVTITEPLVGAIYLTIQGNVGNRGNVIMSVAAGHTGFYCKHRGFAKLKYMTLAGSGAAALVEADRLGGLDLYQLGFGVTTGGVMVKANAGGTLEFADICYFSGDAIVPLFSDQGGKIFLGSFTHQVTVNMTVTDFTQASDSGSLVSADPGGGWNLLGNTVIGGRGLANLGGTIRSASGSSGFYPGTVAVDATTGYYN